MLSSVDSPLLPDTERKTSILGSGREACACSLALTCSFGSHTITVHLILHMKLESRLLTLAEVVNGHRAFWWFRLGKIGRPIPCPCPWEEVTIA